ncbi:hypothetical protein [Streptomyces sp. RKND-216]|uniref:hypothetical protein n=1 Tax=Streptomyces sp. RKND-216 TaxID=2562581 RepID=UPI001447A78E|nr:hypothetical protein [Streptomyces sp. RKND-216]
MPKDDKQCQQCLEHAELHKDLFGFSAFGKKEPCKQCEEHLELHARERRSWSWF